MPGIQNGVNKAKPHVIDRDDQASDIDEMFEQLYKRVGALNVLTTKGDIITYDGSNVVRLPAGSNGQVLTARSSATPGLAWEDRAGTGGVSNGALRFWVNGLPWGVV